MSKRARLLAVATTLGLISGIACSESETSNLPPTGGSGGHTAGKGGGSSGTAHAGTGLVSAGDANESAGQAGESPSEAGAAGAAGSSEGGAAGAAEGGGAGTSTGGTAGGDGTAGAGGTAGVGGASSTFTLQTTALGHVICTASGFTLYVLKTDTPAIGSSLPVSTCSGDCLVRWPIYYANPLILPLDLLGANFGSFDHGNGNGVMQSTYNGWPLYTYALDTAVGDVKGEGLGSKWYALKLPFTSPGASEFTLQTTTLGPVIATAKGLSLYVLITDTVGTSTAAPVSSCTDGCLTVWPPYYSELASVQLGLLASDFASFDRGSGVMQSTYKGRPLYTYAPDTAVGDVKGEGIGSVWYTAKSPFVLP